MTSKKPPFLRIVIDILVNAFINSNDDNVKKLRPLFYVVVSTILTILLLIFDPSLLEKALKFLVSLF